MGLIGLLLVTFCIFMPSYDLQPLAARIFLGLGINVARESEVARHPASTVQFNHYIRLDYGLDQQPTDKNFVLTRWIVVPELCKILYITLAFCPVWYT